MFVAVSFTCVHCFTEDVLTCIWVETDKDKPVCVTRHGYRLNDAISSDVTIYFTRENQNYAGRYYCDTAPSDHSVTVDHCNVHGKGLIACCDATDH